MEPQRNGIREKEVPENLPKSDKLEMSRVYIYFVICEKKRFSTINTTKF